MELNYLIKSIIIIVIFILEAIPVFTQFTGYGNDQVFQTGIRLKKVIDLPPLQDSMNNTCRRGYILMDSLAHVEYCDTIRDMFLKCSLDSLRMLSAYNYEVMDYNPFLFFCYIVTVGFLNNHDSLYKSWPQCFYYGLQQNLQESRIPEYSRQYGLLLTSNYILRVRIDTTVIGIDSTFFPNREVINASATIIEIIKGKKTPCNCKISGGYTHDNYINDSLNPQCMNFSYPIDLYTAVGWGLYPYPTSRLISKVKKGEEYFIFVSEVAMEDWEDQIAVEFRYEATGGLFRIVNNHVEDLENFFGLGYTPSDTDFKKLLLSKIDTLKGWINLQNTEVHENYPELKYLSKNISISPNPAFDFIEITGFVENENWEIFNVLGEKILSNSSDDLKSSDESIKIDISAFPPGIYFLQAGVKVSKFIKF